MTKSKQEGKVLGAYQLQVQTREETLNPDDLTATYASFEKRRQGEVLPLPQIRRGILATCSELDARKIGKMMATTINLRESISTDQIHDLEEIMLDLKTVARAHSLRVANVQLGPDHS